VPAIRNVLIANRGEIAVRVISTLRRMGLRAIAVYSDADAAARHVLEADEAYRLGPANARASYLSVDRTIAACLATGADAVHPGYGFLSESPELAEALHRHDIVFIGPSAHAISVMGDKITAKQTVSAFGIPVVPGLTAPNLTDEQLADGGADVGFPILIKPSAGGGGKGMHVVSSHEELVAAIPTARREARSAFGNDTLFLERYVSRPRHIEVQVLADAHGNVLHLGERECSLQRRHQKVIEEAPSPLLDPATRARIGSAACDTARSVGYTGAGTVEFIVSADQPDQYFFMEMNTRLQVEHPVTEQVTGLDLVEWQIRIARGEKLTLTQAEVQLAGHAVEARVYAEDPARGFLPTGGTVLALAEPRGNGIRVDSGLHHGSHVGSDYDPMLAKVIATAADRRSALAALDAALADTVVLGVTTNINFLRTLLTHPRVLAGDLDTNLLDGVAADYAPQEPPRDILIAAAAYRWLQAWAAASPHDRWTTPDGWRVSGTRAPVTCFVAAGEALHRLRISGSPCAAHVTIEPPEENQQTLNLTCRLVDTGIQCIIDGLLGTYSIAAEGDGALWVHRQGTYRLHVTGALRVDSTTGTDTSAEIRSPMPGTIIAVAVEDGATVEAGDVVVVVEAMKMEHALRAGLAGQAHITVKEGDQVTVDQVLARVTEPGVS
jgi:acetyl-CoA/propionyl-CoA carboxylase biotin carboxyl carrier protein